MSKFTFSFNDNQVVITDAKNNAEPLALLEKLDTLESMRAIGTEQNAAVKASVGALSLLADMLTDARFDFYKGQTPINEKIPKEFNAALREKISEYLKPTFIADKIAKGAKPATAENQWQLFAGGLNTGSFSNAKTWASKFFCQLGKLPSLDNGKLLPLRAIIKMLENAKLPSETGEGIAGKLVKLSSDLESRTEKTELGDYASAIAALKSMLATYEGLYRESLERLTETIGNTDIMVSASAVIAQAQAMPSNEAEFQERKLQWENGMLSDAEFQDQAQALGYDVNIVVDESEPAPV
jgi:hypothetical protein